jgi:hypothetical protein
VTIDDTARSARPSIEQLSAERGISSPATLEALPLVDVFDDGEVEQFLAFIAEARRATAN